MDVQGEIKKVLESDGGWLSRNAMLNRIEGAQESILTYELGSLVKAGELLRINGVNGFEYALPGTRIPNVEGSGAVRRLPAADVAPETLAAKPRGTAMETVRGQTSLQASKPTVASGYNQGQFLSAKEKKRVEEPVERTGIDVVNLRAAIAEVLAANPNITGVAAGEAVGCSQTVASRYLKALRSEPRQAAVSPVADQTPPVEPSPAVATPPPPRGARAAVGQTAREICAYLEQHPKASERQVAQALDLTTPTVAYHMKRIARGVVPPGATWYVDKPATAIGKSTGPAQYALWSTGEFVIKRGDERVVLSVDDTRNMVAYLDRVLLPEEAAAA